MDERRNAQRWMRVPTFYPALYAFRRGATKRLTSCSSSWSEMWRGACAKSHLYPLLKSSIASIALRYYSFLRERNARYRRWYVGKNFQESEMLPSRASAAKLCAMSSTRPTKPNDSRKIIVYSHTYDKYTPYVTSILRVYFDIKQLDNFTALYILK